MADEGRSLRNVYDEAEQKRAAIESSYDTNSTTFQENLLAAIKLYEQCLTIADRISLFSPNESLEDIVTGDLRYLLLEYRVAELIVRINTRERKASLDRARRSYENFLERLDKYEILSKTDSALLETFQDSPNTFSTASTNDPAARRDTKIRRFKEEKALKQKLEYMEKNPAVIQNDEGAARDLNLTNISYCTHQTFQSLESIGQEMHILSLAPPPSAPDQPQRAPDARERGAEGAGGFSERLDAPAGHMSAGMRGPLLDTKGKPLRPFTLTSKRQDLRQGVFRPDHSLPTMSIDDYLEEERKRGGMIEGGGAQSGNTPYVDEDDMDAADAATMKARDWDDFTEANPKGAGNTLNRG